MDQPLLIQHMMQQGMRASQIFNAEWHQEVCSFFFFYTDMIPEAEAVTRHGASKRVTKVKNT